MVKQCCEHRVKLLFLDYDLLFHGLKNPSKK